MIFFSKGMVLKSLFAWYISDPFVIRKKQQQKNKNKIYSISMFKHFKEKGNKEESLFISLSISLFFFKHMSFCCVSYICEHVFFTTFVDIKGWYLSWFPHLLILKIDSQGNLDVTKNTEMEVLFQTVSDEVPRTKYIFSMKVWRLHTFCTIKVHLNHDNI